MSKHSHHGKNRHHVKHEHPGKTLAASPASRALAAEPSSTAQPIPLSGETLDEAIRARAYANWERAGRPEGDGVTFWLEAEAELKAVG
jgi:hypothetical protein